jgi:hypothetical protein
MRGTTMARGARTWAVRVAALGLVFGSLAVGTLTSALPASATVRAATAEKECLPPVTGAAFNYKAVGGHPIKGDKYGFLVVNESCATAATWVAKLTHDSRGQKNADGLLALHGGPSGWTCEGGGEPNVKTAAPTISGECYQGKLIQPTKLIYWESYTA